MSYLRRLGAAVLGRAPGASVPRRHPLVGKASAVGALLSRVMVNMPAWPGRDQEQLAREGYQQNAIVATAIGLVANAVANVTIELHKGRGRRARPVDDHPLLTLLDRPNPEQDRVAFIAAAVSHLMITGNAYLERTNGDEGAIRRDRTTGRNSTERLSRMELYALRPDRMRVLPAADGFTGAYEYRANGGVKRFDIDVDAGVRPVLHLRRFHPVDDWYGMSPLDPAAFAIDVHNSAGAWNKGLLDNAAVPSGAFVYEGNADNGHSLTDEQWETLKSRVDAMRDPSEKGKPLVLDGGLKWQSMSVDPDRMQFTDVKNSAAREIALALGVPPMLLGIPGDNTYSNYQEANRAFHRQTVIPLAEWLARALSRWFEPHLDDDMRLVVDRDSIEALRTERMEMWQALERVSYLTTNEKREVLGWEPVDGGDEVYVNAGLLPIGAPDEGAIAGGPEPEDDEEPAAAGGKRVPPAGKGRLN